MLIGGQHPLLEGLVVAAPVGGEDEGASAVAAKEPLEALGRVAMPNDPLAVAVGTVHFH